MNTFIRQFTIGMVVLLVTMSPLFAEEDSGVDINPVYHIFADVDLVPTTQLKYEKPRIVIKSIVPKLDSEIPDENIDEYNTLVATLIKEETKIFKQEVEDNGSQQGKTKNDLTIDFDSSILNTGNNPIISIRFTMKGFITGVSRPYRHHRVLNYDMEVGVPIELSELFQDGSNYLEVLSGFSRAVLEKKLKDKSLIAAGTEPKMENFQNWNLNPHGLRITFEERRVAPAIYGTQTVLIPYSALKGIIAPESVLAECLAHKTRCFKNTVLTGGFVDEAQLSNPSHGGFDPVFS